MFLNNPKYKPPVVLTKAEKRIKALQPLIDFFIENLPDDVQQIPFDDIRKMLLSVDYKDEYGALVPADLTDAIIMKIADDKGITYA